MLTACLLGVLLLSACVWSFRELEAVTIPTKEWSITVDNAKGQAQAGDAVDIYSQGGSADERGPKALTATVQAVEPVQGQPNKMLLTLRGMTALQPAAAPEHDQTLEAGALRATVTAAQAIPYFDIMYLQTGIVGTMLVAGAAVVYWLVGRKRASVDFLIATDGEMRKVNWSTRREVMGSTWVVIGACFLIAAFLFLIDFSFSTFFKFVGLLKQG